MNKQEKQLKDVTEQNCLRDYYTLVDIMKCIAVKAGQSITPSVITTTLNNVLNAHISHNTVKKYFEAICADGILGKVERYYIKGTGAKLKNADNYYIKDMELFGFLSKTNAIGESLGEKGDEIFKLAFSKTTFYNTLVNLEYDVRGGRIEYSIRSKKVGSKRVGQNIDFMVNKNASSMHFVFLNKKQREALINCTDEAEQFLSAVGSLDDGIQVYVVDVWESSLFEGIGKITLIDFNTAINLLT